MKNSTKRLIMVAVGIGLIVAYIFYYNITNIIEIELHHIFMLGVLVFFTVLSGIRFVIENRIEYHQKWGDTNEGR